MDGANTLHLNITLYGRRIMECFTNQAEPASRSWGLVPGTVYLGTLTGPEHQGMDLVGAIYALRYSLHSRAFNSVGIGDFPLCFDSMLLINTIHLFLLACL